MADVLQTKPNLTKSPSSFNDSARRRIMATFCIFAAATAVILARIIYLASSHDVLRQKLQSNAYITDNLTIPGLRGNIIAPDGKIVAHSERRLNIIWHVPLNYNVAENAWLELSEHPWTVMPPIEQLQFMPGTDVIIAQDLPFDDKQIWEDICASQSLSPRVFFKRIPDRTSPWFPLLGKTEINPVSGLETGVSGLEKNYDSKLRAKTTRCSLLKGKRTFILDSKPADGISIVLPATFPNAISATP